MKKIIAIAVVMMLAAGAQAAFSTAPGYQAQELFNTDGSFQLVGGICAESGVLHFTQGPAIMSLDTAGGPAAQIGTIAANIDAPVAIRLGGQVYAAYSTSLSSPYPYHFGYIDAAGSYVDRTVQDGLFDAAVNAAGECYLSVNTGNAGSRVVRFDAATGGVTEVANIGGYSGGLTFDADGNLYVADQGIWGSRDAAVLRFTPGQLAGGDLTAASGEAVLDIACSYMGFDSAGLFYATEGYPAKLAAYDLGSGDKVGDVAFGGIGHFAWEGDTLYAVVTDYNTWSSSIQAITVPEPATLCLLAMGAAAVLRRRTR